MKSTETVTTMYEKVFPNQLKPAFTFPQIDISFPQENNYVSANLYITFPQVASGKIY